MNTGRLLWCHQKKKEFGRCAVKRVAINALQTTTKHRDHPLKPWELTVRNSDTLTDGRRAEALAIEQNGHKAFHLNLRVVCRQVFREFAEHVGFGGTV